MAIVGLTHSGSSGRIDTSAKSLPMPPSTLFWTVPTSTSTGFAPPGASVSRVTASPVLPQCPAVPIESAPGEPKTKFIVQPAGEIIHEPGRMPTSPGSGASGGAATGAPFASCTRAASSSVNQAGVAAFSWIAWPEP
jgi:hypothetical protein